VYFTVLLGVSPRCGMRSPWRTDQCHLSWLSQSTRDASRFAGLATWSLRTIGSRMPGEGLCNRYMTWDPAPSPPDSTEEAVQGFKECFPTPVQPAKARTCSTASRSSSYFSRPAKNSQPACHARWATEPAKS